MLALPLAAALAGTAGCLGTEWDALPATRLSLATGNRGGVFHRYGGALATVLGRRLTGVTATTRPTDASVENVRLITAGTCDLGFSLADTASDAVRGSGTFDRPQHLSALARTYDSFVQLVVRTDSGLEDLRDLRGTRVGLGAPGSGTRVIARRIMEQAGLSLDDVKVASETLEASAQALRAGRLAAFFFVSGIPNSAVATLAGDTSIRLLPLDRWVPGMVDTYGPEYVPGPIPASTYDLPEGVETVSVKNYILADPAMPDDLAYAITRVIFAAQDEIDRLAPGVRQPSLGAAIFTSPVDLHPGALRYYRQTQP
ncbi:TAXI family TRAP transporter solute-binding subunit [Nocardioides mesophilus]|uniref:TAXI family TRAP transporter solute-binding subunit n=1 Tax=Nocardioides mesophilus TaxID=433659 RepID=A0A7G9R9M4_9ACTN|nr:TAXI family TRAP transporter solute-binding subunit [Nocardioides mesophilus]QNN52299.1 TAXI family TRAP transporter solute-binding subunit [Nocardioides mesophilus]